MLSKILVAWCSFWAGAFGALVFFLLVLSLGSCAGSRPVASPPPVAADSSRAAALDTAARGRLAALPAYLVPAPAGSSPRQRRQWQRAQVRNLARAGRQPQKIKNSSVASAPGATAVNRPSAPVATAPHAAATDARKAGQRHGAGAIGDGAKAEATDRRAGPPWWVYLVVAVVGAIGWELFSVKVAPVRALLRWRAFSQGPLA